MALSNQSGQLAERYGYTPYGKRRVVSLGGATLAASAVGNQVGFTGRYHDAESGLTYFRARYQDAELGRFIGRDPIANRDFSVRADPSKGREALRIGASRGHSPFLGGEKRLPAFGEGVLSRPRKSSLYEFLDGHPSDGLDPLGLQCGPANGLLEEAVPEAFPAACQAHDNCYSTLGANKADCDRALFNDASAGCGSNQVCLELAQVYAGAVSSWAGELAFFAAQVEALAKRLGALPPIGCR